MAEATRLSASAPPQVGRVYWRGQHKVLRSDGSERLLGPPLGKLPTAALRMLVQDHGWNIIDETDDSMLPNFIFGTRKSGVPNYPAGHGTVVRQFPLEVSALLDDKLLMVDTLHRAGCSDLTPAHDDACNYESWGSEMEHVGRFVKHRGGVKGNSVHYFVDAAAARAWLDEKSGWGYYAVQHEVCGRLINGKRFVLRAHLLFTGGGSGLLHEDLICLPYATEYSPNGPKAAAVSQAGKGHEQPYLWTTDFEQCLRIAHELLAALAPATPQLENVCWCHLMGLDLIMDADGRLRLLEVNSYPAMGNGTMSAVPKDVYTRLSRDTISAVVLPALGIEGSEAGLGGFVQVSA